MNLTGWNPRWRWTNLIQNPEAGTCAQREQIKELCSKHGVCHVDKVLHPKEGKIFVPDNGAICLFILKAYHDFPVAGHPGYEKTIELLRRSYWWHNMTVYVKYYILYCNQCARMKGSNKAPESSLLPCLFQTVPGRISLLILPPISHFPTALIPSSLS